jgi:hypothetical protein
MARSLFSAASAYRGKGQEAEAVAALREALRLDPGDSDILYSLALSLEDGSERHDLLMRAHGSGRFSSLDGKSAALDLAESLLTRKDYLRAESVLRGMEDEGPRPALLWCRAAYFGGRISAYESRISEACFRYPDDPRIAAFWLAHARKDAMGAFDALMLKRLRPRLSAWAAADPEMAILAAPFLQSKQERLNYLRSALAAGYYSRNALTAYLEYGLMNGRRAIELFFSDLLPSPSYAELVSLSEALGDDEARRALESILESYTGEVAEDAEGDGKVEFKASYEGGQLMSVSLDADQDGREDHSALFADGLPYHIGEDSEGRRLSLRYAAYPELASIVYDDQDGKREYSLKGHSLFAPLLDFSRPLEAEGIDILRVSFKSDSPAPLESESLLAAARLREELPSPQGGGTGDTIVAELDQGLPLRVETYRQGRLAEWVECERGRPVQGKRDSDLDGRMETSLGFLPGSFWRDRKEAWIEVDQDGDGYNEYREDLRPSKLKSWDCDQDGIIDARAEYRADGSLVLSYSRNRDGRMDLVVEYRDGRLISVTRDGKRMPVIREEGGPVYWIGKKPFDIADDLPAREGLNRRGGLSFLFYRAMGIVVAEVMP